jgi:lipid-binding SYLF domain-containing protein
MKIKTILATTAPTMLCLGSAASSIAATKAQIDQRVAATLTGFNALTPANESLGKKAAGMLVFPKVTMAGVGVAGEYREGALLVNGKTVGYYSIGAASVGLTLGLAKHSEVLMFMTQESLNKFTASDGWAIGADAGITVVSMAASGEYGSKTQQKPILAFAFAEKGLASRRFVAGRLQDLEDQRVVRTPFQREYTVATRAPGLRRGCVIGRERVSAEFWNCVSGSPRLRA